MDKTGSLNINVVIGPIKLVENKLEIAITDATKPKLAGPSLEETINVDNAANNIKKNFPTKIFFNMLYIYLWMPKTENY